MAPDATSPTELEPMQRFRRRMETLRRRALVTAVLLAALGAFLLYQSRAVAARMDAAIVALIAAQVQAPAANGGAALTSAVIVKAPAGITYAPYRWLDQTALAVWALSDGAVQPSTEADLADARRRLDRLIVAYSIQRHTGGTAWVDVALFYPSATASGFTGGGSASHWQLTAAGGQWRVADAVTFISWD
jgi:hypothetical protein